MQSAWQLMEMEMEMEGYEKRNGSEKVKENHSKVKERKRNVPNLKPSFHLQTCSTHNPICTTLLRFKVVIYVFSHVFFFLKHKT